ncbi:MAG: hypothetical protein ABIY38_07330 [Rhodococcus sp. (in: high G+C Gram-positive bacteria)]
MAAPALDDPHLHYLDGQDLFGANDFANDFAEHALPEATKALPTISTKYQ